MYFIPLPDESAFYPEAVDWYNRDMIYLLSGKEIYLLIKQRRALIEKSGVLNENITVFDGSSNRFRIQEALQACATISLFGDRRMVIVDDPLFLNPSRRDGGAKARREENAQALERYARQPNPDCDLLFYCDGFDADQRTKEYKILKPYIESGNIIEYRTPSVKSWEMEGEMNRRLQQAGLQLQPDAGKELLLRVDASLSELERTIDKLLLYGKKTYDKTDIEHLTSISVDQLIWQMCSALTAQDAVGTMRYYQQLTALTAWVPTVTIAAMATVIRRLYISLCAYEHGLRDDEIRARYGVRFPSRDRAQAGMKNSRSYLHLLKELADLEQGIKNGTVPDPKQAVEHFLVKHL